MDSLWSSIWNVIWIFFWSFALISYLFAMFAVIGDLFRDDKLSGWLKAVWILFLVFLPFLTVLVYVIARGQGMAQRKGREMERAREATDDYVRSVASSSPANDIAQAKQLLDSGVISQGEFDALKNRALGNTY